jgi:polyphosphate kinase
LEHARVFYFKNSNPQVYFSSADWMTRNLEKRIELLTPAIDQKVSHKMLEILKLQIADDVQARELGADGEYIKLIPKDGGLDSQKILEDYVSGVFESYSREQNSKEAKVVSKLLKES